MAMQTALAKDIHILALGDSIASNCNGHVHAAEKNVYQISLDGSLVAARDPLAWSDCTKGSMWIPLGRDMIKSGMADRVILMPVGLSGSLISDWQKGGKAFEKLNSAIRIAKAKKIHFDYVLWHQGSADISTDGGEYFSRLDQIIKHVGLNVPVKKWLIAENSSCYGHSNAAVAEAQHKNGRKALYARFPGPDTNSIGKPYRIDGCNLNEAGQNMMAGLWLQAIKKADIDDIKFTKETLVHYFR